MQLRSLRSGALFLTVAATGLTTATAPAPVGAAKGKAAPGTVKAPSPTGRLVYKSVIDTPMGPMSGTMTLIWTDGGKKFRQETQLSGSPKGAPAGSPVTNISSWSFGDGKNLYTSMPMMGQTVYRQAISKQAALGAPVVDSAKQGKLVGKGTILGRSCEIREIPGAKLWMWKGLALKMDKSGGPGPTMKMTATKLDMPYKTNPGMFKVPAGYTVTDQLPGMSGMPGGGPGGAPKIRKGSQ